MRQVFVFDLDGVLRYWNPGIIADAERHHGLPKAALSGAAFEPDLLLKVVTGRISDEFWREEITRRLAAEFPSADVVGAVAAWSGPVGELIDGSLDVLASIRKIGTVCLLSNATSRLESDLAALGLEHAFDHIFNSSRIGYAKPDPRIYEHVEQALGVVAERIVYLDDGAANVQAASERGWQAILVEPGASVPQLLAHWLG